MQAQNSQVFATTVPVIGNTGTTTFLMNLDKIIRKSLKKFGVTNPQPDEYQSAADELNLIMNDLQNSGTLLWKQREAIVPLIATYPSYYLDPLMTDAMYWFFRQNGNDTEITPFTRENYMAQSTKKEGGEPNRVWVNWQLQQPIVHFYPVWQYSTGFVKVGTDSYLCILDHISDATNQPVTGSGDWQSYWEICTIATALTTSTWVTGTSYSSGVVYFTKTVRAEDVLSARDDPDAPVRWDNALVWLLADALSPEHALQAWERQDLQQRAMIAKASALAGGRESVEMRVFPEFRR